MKRIASFLIAVVMLAAICAGCGTEPAKPSEPAVPSTPAETAKPSVQPTPAPTPEPTPAPSADPDDPLAGYDCITIAEALSLCEQFVDAPSSERYYIRAVIDSIDNDTYGQMTISDKTGTIMVYGTASADGTVRYDAMESKPVAGDEVLLYGTLQNYKGNTKEIQNGWIIGFISNSEPVEPSELPADGTELTIAEILSLPVANGVTTTEKYIVKAVVESVSNAAYGAMWITDETGSISVYNSKNADGTVGYADMEDKPYKGDSVVLECTVQNFNGEMEIKQAYIMEFQHAESEVDPAEYTEMSIADARKAASGTKVKVSGVIARITYANGMIPAGVILVDDSSSIYVYDGDLAARCTIGSTVSIYASKTYWILESEQGNAAKFGYQGCNQLENVSVISIEDGSAEFSKNWIQTSTVKDILDTSVKNDITSLIYKVTAQVVKAPGNGFTNYYINDLDGTTGTYVYTQCNGSDFAWLDEFDGKICTVYLMALNAKSTSSDCFWRFLPVAVLDEGFDPASVNVAEHIVKYYGVPQFLSSYSGDPALELLTSVDSELLNFTGASLSYASSDPALVSVDGGVMHCLKSGEVTITVTGSYGEQTYSETVKISVKVSEPSVTYPTVSTAIDAAIGDTVTVMGIVGPSLVNKSGFYLIDETGVIAVETTADVLATLEIGHQVVLEAVRAFNTKDNVNGQTCLKDAVVVVNNYGSHAYSTAAFKGEISVADFYNLDIGTDYTTSVFTMKATVVIEETNYYTNIFLSDGSTKVRLYCSSANQYNWLKAFAGQEVTVEIAACNWNSKDYYTGCVLAVVNGDGTKTLNNLNFQ